MENTNKNSDEYKGIFDVNVYNVHNTKIPDSELYEGLEFIDLDKEGEEAQNFGSNEETDVKKLVAKGKLNVKNVKEDSVVKNLNNEQKSNVQISNEQKSDVQILNDELQRQEKLKNALLELIAKEFVRSHIQMFRISKTLNKKTGEITEIVKNKAIECEGTYKIISKQKESIVKEYNSQLKQVSDVYKKICTGYLNRLDGYRADESEAIKNKNKFLNEKRRMQATQEYKIYESKKSQLIKEFEKALLENDEGKEKILRNELEEHIKRDPTLKYDKKIKETEVSIREARTKISEIENYLNDFTKKRDERLNEIQNDINNAFSGLVKQNFWQKLLGSITNKFFKAKKITGGVFDKIKVLTAKVKEDYERIYKEYEIIKAKEEEKQTGSEVLEANRRQRQEKIITDLEERLRRTQEELDKEKAKYELTSVFDNNSKIVPYNSRKMTPAFGGNSNIVPFERD